MTRDVRRMPSPDAPGSGFEDLERHEERERRRKIQDVGRRLVPRLGHYQRIQSMYDASNETPRRALQEIVDCLAGVESEEDAVALVMADVNAFINGVRLKLDRSTTDQVLAFGRLLSSYGLGGIVFLQGVRKESIATFYKLLDEVGEGDDARPKLAEALTTRGINDLALIPPKVASTNADDAGQVASLQRQKCVETYTTGLLALGVGGKKSAAPDAVRRRRQSQVVRNLIELGEEDPDNVMNLASIRDAGDPFSNHVMATTVLSLSLGMSLGLSRKHLLRLGLCAMHADVGESHLPDELVEKTEDFTADERAEMQTHSVKGFAHLLDKYGFNAHSLERALVSLEHHLSFDLKGGYPEVKRSELHLFSRMIAICDTYNALLSERPHRSAFTPDQAVKILARGSGSRFDPMLCKVFLQSVGTYPPGSLVELSTGEVAVVFGAGRGDRPMDRPKVVLVQDERGKEVQPPRLADLHAKIPGRRAFKRSIVRPLDPEEMGINPSGYLFHKEMTAAGAG